MTTTDRAYGRPKWLGPQAVGEGEIEVEVEDEGDGIGDFDGTRSRKVFPCLRRPLTIPSRTRGLATQANFDSASHSKSRSDTHPDLAKPFMVLGI